MNSQKNFHGQEVVKLNGRFWRFVYDLFKTRLTVCFVLLGIYQSLNIGERQMFVDWDSIEILILTGINIDSVLDRELYCGINTEFIFAISSVENLIDGKHFCLN